MHHALAQKHLLPAEHLLDRGYVDTQVLIDSETNHGLEVIGPIKVDTTWQAQAGKGCAISCCTLDWDNQSMSPVQVKEPSMGGQPR